MMLRRYACAAFLVAIGVVAIWLFVGVLERGGGTSPGKQRLNEALNGKYVTVARGQSAAIKLPSGYALIVPDPEKMSLNYARCKVIFWANGKAGEGQIVEEPEGSLIGTSITIEGHRIVFSGAGPGILEVRLDIGDSNVGIALYGGTKPSRQEMAALPYQYNVPLDEKRLEDALREVR